MLHIFPSFGFGGQQARLATLVTGLGSVYRHHIVALDGDLSAQSLVPDSLDVAYQKLSWNKGKLASFTNIFRWRKLFAQIKPDILFTYNWGAMDAVLANVTGPKLPHIHFEDGFGPDETLQQQHRRRVKMRRLALRHAHVVVPSRGLKKTATEQWGGRRRSLAFDDEWDRL